MDDFDRLLEAKLALMLDWVVRAPAPPRRGRLGLRPIVALHTTPAVPIGPAAKVAVLADLPVEVIADVVASPETTGLTAPALS